MDSPRLVADLVMIGFCAGCIGAAYVVARLIAALVNEKIARVVNALALVAVLALTVPMVMSAVDALGMLG